MGPSRPRAFALAAAALLASAPARAGESRPTRETRAPQALIRALRAATTARGWCARSEWRTPAPLGSERFTPLPGGRVLVFLQIPDYLCTQTNGAVPAVIDARGRWRWGHALDGEVTLLALEGATVFAATQWQIEGTYPTLSRSTDGLRWAPVELPQNRAAAGPAEELSALCVSGKELRVCTRDPDGAGPECWTRSTAAGPGAWRALDSADPCPASAAKPLAWTRSVGPDEVRLNGAQLRIVLPSMLAPR